MSAARPAAALALGLLLSTVPAGAATDLDADALLRDHLFNELRAMPAKERPTVGVVFSAGSLRATAHVGVISVLENAGFPVDVVAGTSMGAIVGSLYAGGWSAKRLWQMGENLDMKAGTNLNAFSLFSLVFFDNLLSSENVAAFIRGKLGNKRFEDLKRPFACVAMDISTGESIIFRDGEVAPAVRASMNLPGIFSPVEYRHRYLVDGGVVNYIPIDAARLLGARWVLASITEADYTASRPSTVLENLEQVIDIRGSFLSQEQRKQADFLIEPNVGDIGLHETTRSKEAMEKGVIAAYKRLPAAQESLILHSLPALQTRWEAR